MQPEVWAEIKRLHAADKVPIAEIARRVRRDRKTVRRALAAQGLPVARVQPPRPSKLDPYKPWIKERLDRYPDLPSTTLFEEIKRQGYAGKIRIVTEYLASIRRKAKEVFLRIETPPGEQAQCDWANCGSVRIGETWRKLSCFVMVLSYSRLMYLEFTLSQCLEDFLGCHVNAFKYFGGIPKKILYDNLKLVVLSRLGTDVRFNPKFMEFSGIHGFEPVLCNPARGNEKGKVESGIHYVRSGLLAGREPLWPDINAQARRWLDETANVRLHRTTRERPVDRWEKEKPRLFGLPSKPYDASIAKAVRSSHQALVRFDGNAYSVPHVWAYQTLLLRADSETVALLGQGKEIARHPRSWGRGAVIEDPRHFEGILAAKRKASASKLKEHFLALGPIAQAYLGGIIQAEGEPRRHVARIMELASAYGKEEVIEAMRHALAYKAFGAAYVQNVLLQRRTAKGLKEFLPLEIPQKPAWNEIVTEEPDLALYDKLSGQDAEDGHEA